MKIDETSPLSADEPAAVAVALERNQDVKAKVEVCADELGSANEDVKKKIAEGETILSAPEVLKEGKKVEGKVQQFADELHEVNETLARGLADLRHLETTLSHARTALAKTEAALAIARREEEKARQRALHDFLTGLPNRELFDHRLEQAIAIAERHDWTLAVMFLDLDRFKSINDTHGHAAGDSVLKEVANRLMKHCRKEDTVCRNGGDEFLYLLIDPQGSENVERIAGLVFESIAQPIDIGGSQIVVRPSIGIAGYPADGTTVEQLVRSADTAMYRAKDA